MSCEILLIRHGETDWNVERRIQGSTDVPLNERGREQARDLATAMRREPVDAAWSSDLRRAAETAETLLGDRDLPLRTDRGLRERDYGDFRGLTRDEVRQRYPAECAAWKQRVPDAAVPGDPENLREFAARVAATLNRIADTHPEDRVLVVAHGGVLDAAYRLAAKIPLDTPRDFPLKNATLNRIERAADGWRVVSWGEG